MTVAGSAPHKGWRWAFALATVPALVSVLFFVLADQLPADHTNSSWIHSALRNSWLLVSIGCAVACGALTGPSRGVGASVGVWAVFALILLLLFGSGCPLNMSRAPQGTAALAYLGHTETCSDGRRASELGGLAGWVVLLGMAATALTAAGAAVGGTARWLRN